MRGGNEGTSWFCFALSVIYLLVFLSFNRRWKAGRSTAQHLRVLDPNISVEEGADLLQKHSFLMLVSSGLFVIAGITALLIYRGVCLTYNHAPR